MRKFRIHQLLLTRFNIRTPTVGYTQDQSPEWLERRFELFSHYCVPSVAAQVEEEFDWIVFCDPWTAPETLDRIRAFDPRIRIALWIDPDIGTAGLNQTSAVETPDIETEQQADVLSTLEVYPHVRQDAEVVLSTRLDNDDALNHHALRRVRDHVDRYLETGHDRWLYNPLLGYKLDIQNQRLFTAVKHNSAFLTMFERNSDMVRPAGPYAGNHSCMYKQYPTYQDDGMRLWLMVVHGENVVNGIRQWDEEIPFTALGDEFVV